MKDLGYFLNQRDNEGYKRIKILIIIKSLLSRIREIIKKRKKQSWKKG